MIEYDHHIHVYYRDVDQMGIVYYTRYLEYFEEARTELLRKVGINVTDIEKLGYFLPVIKCSCSYKNPAKFDEELTISTKIIEEPRSTLRINYEVINKSGVICVNGETIHTFINKKGNAIKPPKNIIEKLRGYSGWKDYYH